MTAPTPGPWIQPMRYDPESGCDIPCGAIEAQGTGIIVASARDMTMPEWAANARLIAAAPDLLTYARRFFAAHDGTAGLTPEEVAAWRAVVRGVEG